MQAPQEYVDKYQFIKNETRRYYAAMVDIVDEAIGNVTQAMKHAGWVAKAWCIYQSNTKWRKS